MITDPEPTTNHTKMTNRWESSKRPLFVRTVFVNGSRHAILSQEDPLCQPSFTPSSRKQSRPSSSQSFSSVSSTTSSKISLGKRFKEQENKDYDNRRTKNTKITNDLQGCLVKLRLVLETNEKKQKTKPEKQFNNVKKCVKMKNMCENYRRRKRTQEEKKNCSFCEQKLEKNGFVNVNLQSKIDTEEQSACLKYDDNQNITNPKEAGYYYYNETGSELSRCCCEKDANITEIRDLCCCETENNSLLEQSDTDKSNCGIEEKKFVGNYSRPYQPNILTDKNETWNNISTDSFFTKPIYNPLSERVLQWLDLASKKKAKPKEEKVSESQEVERISNGNRFLDENGKIRTDRKIVRSKSEGKMIRVISKEQEKKESIEKDVEEEVKTETDVETVLSTAPEPHVYPKYTDDLNKTAKPLPKKEETQTITLKVEESLNAKQKKVNKPPKQKKYVTISEKRSLLMRQPKLQESEEEDTKIQNDSAKMKRNAFSHRNSFINKTIEGSSRKNDLLTRYKEKYLVEYKTDEETEEEKNEKVFKYLQTTQILSTQLQNKIPWLRDYSHGANGCRNMWPSDKATSKPQLHIFMPAIAQENNVSNPDDSISECESFSGDL